MTNINTAETMGCHYELGYKRHCTFCWPISLFFSEIAWSKESQLPTLWRGPYCENLRHLANSQQGTWGISSTDKWVSHLGSRCFNLIQAFRWPQVPADTLTATPWQTLSQNHLAKPLQLLDFQRLWDSKCLLLQVTKFWWNLSIFSSQLLALLPSGPPPDSSQHSNTSNLTFSYNRVRPNSTINPLLGITKSSSASLSKPYLIPQGMKRRESPVLSSLVSPSVEALNFWSERPRELF